ncbi:hypothetical protein AJ79_04986 [Helicocarpus griseus UAMH5409]|uniref:Asp/Glu/hydantoin racemase n=1 Tax=Helicocarpus griseus UAMH5409 TaxID=1447875 RepID=A0A2B7XRJ3_9EURO|nr:hypothetical protein AJ79_04986 [Helicocarpus griseus UAMH5409]
MPLRLGLITPSSNTALEPLTNSILSSLPTTTTTTKAPITAHFTRIRLTQISLSPAALNQFHTETFLSAARLLADAQVDVIAWSGTASGWLGFDVDSELCRRITLETGGIPCTTANLALNRALELLGGVERMGLLTPFVEEVQERIVANYRLSGFEAVCEKGLAERDNVAIGRIGEEVLDGAVERVVGEARGLDGDGTGGLQAICIFCTNLHAAQRVEYWEEKYGVPVLDTITAVVWDMLRICGVDTSDIRGWGQIMRLK